MKNNYTFEVKISDEQLRKIIAVSEAEGRSLNNQILLLVRNYIQYFERVKGKLNQSDLQKIDLSGYGRDV